jgi:hypothetical protein
MYWIDLAQDTRQVEGSCEHGNEFSGSIKYWKKILSFWANVGYSRMTQLHGVS